MLRRSPVGASQSTVSTEFPISCSCHPAFITSAPPIVPGIPTPNSRPANPCVAATRATAGNDAPAPHSIRGPSRFTSSRTRLSRKTRPRTPASRTSRLEPLPRTRQATLRSAAQRTAIAASLRSAGMASSSAGPPMRQVV